MSDCSIRSSRGILDLGDKEAFGCGWQQAGGCICLLAAGAAIAVTETSSGDGNIND
jgi:hypothetical protein